MSDVCQRHILTRRDQAICPRGKASPRDQSRAFSSRVSDHEERGLLSSNKRPIGPLISSEDGARHRTKPLPHSLRLVEAEPSAVVRPDRLACNVSCTHLTLHC